jgi:hypothetical protein
MPKRTDISKVKMMGVETVKQLLIPSFWLCCSVLMGAQQWHPMASSFCSEIKAKGAKVSNRPFLIFKASDPGMRCSEGLDPKAKGKTEDYGHFRVLDLERGRYFLSFDLKTKQVNVPILVDHIVDKRYYTRDCKPDSRITVEKNTNELKWEDWVIVD